MKLNGVEIEETFAELFPMNISRILITAATQRWALASAQEAKGLGTTQVFCPTEAGIGSKVPATETPDRRPGVTLYIGHQKMEKVKKWLPIRIRHCILSVATTAVFDASPQELVTRYIELDKTPPKLFGAGYEEIVEAYGRTMYRIPLMGGWFYVETKLGVINGVAGGNFYVMGEGVGTALMGAEVAVDAIKSIPDVFTPAVNGIFASGSKPAAEYPWAVTNYQYCSCIKNKVKDSKIPDGVSNIFEVVINGLTLDAVKDAMKTGIAAATTINGVKKISAGNYKGTLGPYKVHLHELI